MRHSVRTCFDCGRRRASTKLAVAVVSRLGSGYRSVEAPFEWFCGECGWFRKLKVEEWGESEELIAVRLVEMEVPVRRR